MDKEIKNKIIIGKSKINNRVDIIKFMEKKN